MYKNKLSKIVLIVMLFLLFSCNNQITNSETTSNNNGIDLDSEVSYNILNKEDYESMFNKIISSNPELNVIVSYDDLKDEIIFEGSDSDIDTLLDISKNYGIDDANSRGWFSIPTYKYHSIIYVKTNAGSWYFFDNHKAINSFSSFVIAQALARSLALQHSASTSANHHSGHRSEGWYTDSRGLYKAGIHP